MKNKQINLLKKIVETPSPTGSETAVADIVRKRLAGFADEISTDTMGSVHAVYLGAEHRKSLEAQDGAAGEPADLDDASAQSDQDWGQGLETPTYGMRQGSAAADGEVQDGGLTPNDPFEASGAGVDDERSLTLMLAAHMDEIGLMVTYISDDGFLSVAAIGGVDPAILPGMRVNVHAEGGTLLGVVGRKPIHLIEADDRKSVTPLDKLVIDLGMPAKRVKKLVRVGDSITFAVGLERFGRDMAVSRAFDDKVGVFIACRVMENLASDPDYAGNFVAAITTQEEIGTRGAMTSAHSVRPDVALAFDVTHATDYPGIDKSKYGDIACGRGPVIARGPNINPVVFKQLVRAAEEEGIAYQLEAEPSVTGTDARAIQVSRGGIPTGLVSIPLRYMHTPTEVISLSDVEGAVRLITRFAQNLSDVRSFVPGFDGPDSPGDAADSVSEEELSDSSLQDEGDEPISPEDAPFGRQMSALSAELGAYDFDSGDSLQDASEQDDLPAPVAESVVDIPEISVDEDAYDSSYDEGLYNDDGDDLDEFEDEEYDEDDYEEDDYSLESVLPVIGAPARMNTSAASAGYQDSGVDPRREGAQVPYSVPKGSFADSQRSQQPGFTTSIPVVTIESRGTHGRQA